MSQKDEINRIEPRFGADAEAKPIEADRSPNEAIADDADHEVRFHADDDDLRVERRRNWRPLAFAATLAVTAGVAAVVGATVNTALHPGLAVGLSGDAAPVGKRLDDLASDIAAMRTTLDTEVRRIDDRLSGLEGGKPAAYTPPSTPRRVDGEQQSSATPAPHDVDTTTVAAITPPVPRAKPDIPVTRVAQPLGAPPANLGTLPGAGPTVVFAPPLQAAPRDEPPRFRALGNDGGRGPGIAPPMPIPGAATDEAQSIPGWRVVDVVGDRAIIDGGFIGTFEVEPGMELPEVGVIDSIYRGSGGWVVATSRGIITSNP